MKKVVIIGASILSASAEASDASLITVEELQSRGINPQIALSRFEAETGVQLSLTDLVKVSYDEEGNGIRLESLDHISVVIPLMDARYTENKADGSTV